jgi:hypothetical protein
MGAIRTKGATIVTQSQAGQQGEWNLAECDNEIRLEQVYLLYYVEDFRQIFFVDVAFIETR